MRERFIIGLAVLVLLGPGVQKNSFAQPHALAGSIEGRLIDAETKTPLIGANVSLLNTTKGAATDANGHFVIAAVPVGSYTLRFSYIGYETYFQTDVIVRSKRITFVDTALKISTVQMREIVVTPGYFQERNDQPVSAVTFSREEIRRAPGAAGDISRIVMSLPSIAKINDQSNNLIVRGGSPIENAFYIDNIEIPNINHFPVQGTSGGSISVVNVDFIQEVNFLAGGFSPAYGDRLASIMEIKFREGNRNEFDGQMDLNFAGFGGTVEGPFAKNQGSYLCSLRRSYLDLLIKAIEVGTSVAPRYGDFQGKVVYDLSPKHKLTVLAVHSDDHNRPSAEAAEENDMIYYGNQDLYETSAGINWSAVWNKIGYSNTALSFTASIFNEDGYETGTALHILHNRSQERFWKLRNLNHFRISKRQAVEVGVEAKRMGAVYDNFYGEYTGALGDTTAALVVDKTISCTKMGAFANHLAQPHIRLTATLGVRADYFSYNKKITVTPRMSLSYRLNERTTIDASAGLYAQNLPIVLLAQDERNRKLHDPLAAHFIVGLKHLVTENTQLTVEVYQKNYQRFPVEPNASLFVIDELFYRYGFFFDHAQLVDVGKASSRGVEFIVQKKLAQKLYGMASLAYFRAKYRAGDGKWRDRVFDNRYLLSIEGGYKPNKKWEFSLRWIYAGGAPYTPFDITASQTLRRGVLDAHQINTARYPDYHSLNIRFDRRFHFLQSNLVFYFSVWNVYNRKNVASYYWNVVKNVQDTILQWGTLPIFGLEYEF